MSKTINLHLKLSSAQVLTVLAKVPSGRVVSFGDLAYMAGYPGKARWVGTVLSKLPAHTQVPWHRVVNAQGILTCPRADLAKKRLISEGVSVRNSRVSMKKHRWSPEQPAGKVADSTED